MSGTAPIIFALGISIDRILTLRRISSSPRRNKHTMPAGKSFNPLESTKITPINPSFGISSIGNPIEFSKNWYEANMSTECTCALIGHECWSCQSSLITAGVLGARHIAFPNPDE